MAEEEDPRSEAEEEEDESPEKRLVKLNLFPESSFITR